MRQILLLVCVLALHAVPEAQAPQNRPQQGDAVVRLLSDLETALAANQDEAFRSIAAAGLPAADLAVFQQMREGDGPAAAVVRERDRLPEGDGYSVLADLLVSHGLDGRIATWQITTRPSARARDRFEVAGLKQLAMVDGLIKLVLDRTQQYTVHNLVVTAPDLTLKMASGTAFVAQGVAGRTALVLRGRAELHFAPPDTGEQAQMRIFSRRPALDTALDAAFIRINPAAFTTIVSEHSLIPSTPNPADLSRGQEIFDQFAGRTYGIGLSDLSTERWSLLPVYGNIAIEFKSARYGWLTYTRAPGDAEDITLFDRARGRNLSVYASAEKVAERGRFYDEDADVAYDVTKYDLDLSFDPARSWVSGRSRLNVRLLNDGVRTLSFRLAEPLVISSITSPELGRLLAMRVVGQTSVIVSLPDVVNAGRQLTFEFAYSGRLESQELSREAMAIQGQTQATTDFIQAMPEPRFMYSNHVYWYPQATSTDYALARMRLTVPSEYQVIASGSLVGSSVGPLNAASSPRGDVKSVRTVEFFADRPLRYLSCVITRLVPIGRATVDVPAVAPMVAEPGRPSQDAPSSAVYLEVTSTPRVGGRNRLLPALAADAIRFYARLFGEAPYPNLTVAAADSLLPGGHSPAYFALLQQPLPATPFTWRDDPLAFDRYPNFLLAHEVAHQWWGQAVGFKNYHEQWLSEGLAQYSAAMFLSANRPETMRALIKEMRQSAEPLLDRGPIYLGYRLGHIEGRGAVFRGIVYNKSAVVLHMLRRLIGDEAFTKGLQRFYRQWRFQKAGTDDLRQAFETEAGRPLGRFFDRWILGAAVPRLRVTSHVENGGDSALIRIEQVGDLYDVPLTIGVEYVDGRTEEVSISISDALVEQRIPLKGPVRKIGPRDELTLANFVN